MSKLNRRRLFYDIETSPNIGFFWRSGYKLQIPPENILEERAIICISYKWEGGKVKTLTWDRNNCDKKMLEKFVKVLERANEIVAHNGDKFDIKWIKGRCAYHRIPIPPRFITIDTCTQSRKHFGINSHKLDYLGEYFNVGRKHETGGFDLWKRIVLNKDRKSLKKMVEYCEKDVILLERVYNVMKNYIDIRFNHAVMNEAPKYCCPECTSNRVYLNKTRTTVAGTIRREMKCKDCKRNFTVSNKTYSDLLVARMNGNA